jgi:ribose transport system ATP-binding protein
MRLSVRGVSKAFGSTQALSDVTFSVQAGSIHAVLGENGAGKSTLMKVLSGALRPDHGTLLLDGAAYAPESPSAARQSGVAIVYQEVSLCPHLTVAENVLLGAEPRRYGFVRRGEARARARRAVEQLARGGQRLELEQRVSELSSGDRQLVEIARALAADGTRLLILDEPTSSLTGDAVERLFDVLRGLRERGLSILYISHFLEEVRRIADDYTVLRDGRTVTSGRIAEASNDDLVRAMVGQSVRPSLRSPRAPGKPALVLSDVAGAALPQRASLELRRGEVLGISGLIGSGRSELLRAIFGLDPVRRGEVRVGLVAGPASPALRLAQGLGLLSEDRAGEGLLLGRSVADNLTLSRLAPLRERGLLSTRRVEAAANHWVQRLDIRCNSVRQPVAELSGGNQQKVALARLLHHDVDVLLLDEPTRGVDVRCRTDIHTLIDELARQGKAVLIVSSQLPELLAVCDRIAVMRRGVLGPARPAEALSEHALLQEATGLHEATGHEEATGA